MRIIHNWFFWLIVVLIPFILTLAFSLSCETMTVIYLFEILLSIIIWWFYEKIRAKRPDEF
jgi:nicotinamide riboside transporter PnuC